MALKAVKDAVEARIDLSFSGCERIGLNGPGSTAGGDGPYLTIEYPVAHSEQLTFGAPGQNLWREEGAFLIVLGEVRGVGTDGVMAWAEELAKLFRGIQILEPDCTIQCWAPGSPALDDGDGDGKWFEIRFAVPYTADITG